MADHPGADAPAKYFFEIGYFAAYADAIVRFGVAPYGVTDAIVDKAWQDAREGTADPAEFDRMRDQADASRSGRPVAHSVGGDAVREALARVEFPYQETFNAIGDAVEAKPHGISISVHRFQSSLRAALAKRGGAEG